MAQCHVQVASDQVKEFCQKHGIQKLSFFGSVLRDDFGAESDVDVLVEFVPGVRVGFIRLAGMEQELAALIGRKVDMRTPAELSRYFRDDVVRSARVEYVKKGR